MMCQPSVVICGAAEVAVWCLPSSVVVSVGLEAGVSGCNGNLLAQRLLIPTPHSHRLKTLMDD